MCFASAVGARAAFQQGQRPDGTLFVLATWWMSPSDLGYAEQTEDGPLVPFESLHAHGSGSYSPSLVNEAIRIVRDR